MFKIKFLLIQVFLLLSLVHPVASQEQNELSLRMTRTFGYSSRRGKIQGNYVLKASKPDDLEKVVFYIDDVIIGQSSEFPHNLRFNTDSLSLGEHRIHAIGYTSDGRPLQWNEIQAIFVTAEKGVQTVFKIIVPLLGVIFLAAFISFAFTILTGRKMKDLPPGTPRNYAVAGGAICPRCRRSYARHYWSPNLIIGKFERCPFCGKWAIVAASSNEELCSAGLAEINSSQEIPAVSQETGEEHLRKELEVSRFQDL